VIRHQVLVVVKNGQVENVYTNTKPAETHIMVLNHDEREADHAYQEFYLQERLMSHSNKPLKAHNLDMVRNAEEEGDLEYRQMFGAEGFPLD
jgi:hypothetical protein